MDCHLPAERLEAVNQILSRELLPAAAPPIPSSRMISRRPDPRQDQFGKPARSRASPKEDYSSRGGRHCWWIIERLSMDVNAIESAWGSGVKRSSRGSAFVAKFENRLPAALHLSQSRGERRCLIVVANSRSRRRPRPRVAQNSIGCTPTKAASSRAFRCVSKLRSSSM